MSDAVTAIKGFADLFPPESDAFTRMEAVSRDIFFRYGYRELRTPLLERTELFSRGIGTETDVVQKEMYTFPDRKGRSLTLRPEATAGVIRAFVESGRNEAVSKFFTCGPMFRYERPQKGRMRQFHQINCECVGPSEPWADAEIIVMAMRFLLALGIEELTLHLNSLGCPACRPAYRNELSRWLSGLDPEALCEDCRRRMITNPLRVLDCKVPSCREHTEQAPKILDHNCPDCAEHFAVTRRLLDAQNIPYVIDHRLVRGLDYYTRTTFEVVSARIGAQGTVAGGGRYDGLVAQLGGPDLPGLGFACGMERLGPLVPPRGGAGIAGPLLGEEGQEGLLHGVGLLVAGEVELHCRAWRTKVLRERSVSRSEVPSWPGHTRRFPSRFARRLRDCKITPKLPPTKSVRPQEPAKRVSPQKSTSPTWKVREPGEWPGVWRTWISAWPKGMLSPSLTVWMPSTGARSMYWSPLPCQLTSFSWTYTGRPG